MNKRILVAIPFILYVLSLTQPTFFNGDVVNTGWQLWIGGAIGIWIMLKVFITWLANPLFLAGIILLIKKKKATPVIALLALIFGLAFLPIRHFIHHETTDSDISSYRLGYWLWLSSMAALLISSIIGSVKSSSR